MAWAEKRGPWYRVRYRDSGGVVRTTPDKYRSKKDAEQAAEDIDTDTTPAHGECGQKKHVRHHHARRRRGRAVRPDMVEVSTSMCGVT